MVGMGWDGIGVESMYICILWFGLPTSAEKKENIEKCCVTCGVALFLVLSFYSFSQGKKTE